jgi:hypothetical protein
MDRRPLLPLAAALALAAVAPASQAQPLVQCESHEYGYAFCQVAAGVDGVRLREQRSRSACIEGRTWGWDRRGIWVDRGCEGVFEVSTLRAPPVRGAAAVVPCESRNYQYEFCGVPETIVAAQLVRQRSAAACVEGRTWGWRPNGVWVSGGCEGDFEVRTSAPPLAAPPPRQGLLYCESRDYGYTFCPTGRLRSAELVQQRSESTCEYGRSWGYQNDGVWVDRGCAGEFALRPN